MTNADDPLGQAISVSDELVKRGIKGGLNQRAVVAIDRLLGGAVDFLRAPAEEGDRKKPAPASETGKATEIIPPILAAHYREIYVRHENRKAVVAHALEELKRMAQRVDNPRGAVALVSADWLNFFAGYAEKASSEKLRQTFGHVLGAEIHRPGSFSFSTLRIVSELDAGSASLFQKLAARAFSMDAKNATPSVLLKPENLQGPFLHQMLRLEALGLIQQVGGDFAISTSNAEPGAQIWVRFGRLLLRGELKTKAYLSLPLVKLTDAGAELCSIIPMDHHGGAQEVGSLMAKRGLTATVHMITGLAHGEVHYRMPGEEVKA